MSGRIARALAAVLAAFTVDAVPADNAADVEALLAALEQLPDEVLQADPALWQDVLAVLQQQLVRAQGAPRRDEARPAAQLGDAVLRFPAVYRQMVAELRSGTGDLASRVLLSAFDADGSRRGAPTLEELAAQAGAVLPDKAQLTLGMSKVEAVNARTPDAQPLTEGMRDQIEQLNLRGAQHARELMKLQGSGREMAARLARLDSLVNRSTALAAPESLADEADVSQLRAEFSALRVAQQEAFAAFAAEGMPVAPGQLQAPRSATSPRIDRNAVAGELRRQIQALRDAGGERSRVALRVAQCELYLAAIDVLNGEELVKAAALYEGARRQAELMQVGAEARRLGKAIDRASAR